MIKLKAIKYRIYPNKTQTELLNKTFGCVRKIWNEYVAVFNSHDKITNPNPKYNSVKELKEKYKFLKEVPYNALEQKVMDFNQFKNQYFNPKRKTKLGRPNFKGRNNHQSFRLSSNGFKIHGDKLYLAKIGEVILSGSKNLSQISNVRNVTISKTPDGKMYASVLSGEVVNPLPQTGNQIGIDLGLIDLVADSQGNKIKNPKFLEREHDKIKKLHQVLSRKKKGSKRRNKTRIKLARRYQKIKNQRNWYSHQISTDLVRKYDLICCEDLNISGMLANHRLAKSISSASWYSLIEKLRYKCDWYGKTFYQIGTFFPSSKTCSSCGVKTSDMNLGIRSWTCSSCYTVHDRDINAAKNILAEGKRLTGL